MEVELKVSRYSELSVQSRGKDRDWSTIAVVRRIDDELVVEGHPTERHREAVVRLKDLLGAWMRKLSVPGKNAKTTRVEKCFMLL